MKQLTFLLIIQLWICSAVLFAQNLPDLIPFRKGNLWGYCDKNQTMVIPLQFDDAYPFYEGKAVVGKIKTDKTDEPALWYGCIDTQGKVIIDFDYAYISPWQQGLAYSVGLLKGQEMMTAQIINPKEEIIIKGVFMDFRPRFTGHSEIWFVKNNLVMLPDTTNAGVLVYDLTGKEKLHYKTEFMAGAFSYFIEQFHKSYPYFISFTAEQGYSVLNLEGKTVIPAGRFERIEGFSDGLFVVGKLKPNGDKDYRFDYTFGYANEQGELLIDYKFTEAHPFSEGLAKASVGTSYEDATWGYIDKKGNWVIPPQFGYAENFQEGLAYVCLKSKTATGETLLTKPKFIDKSGKTVIETEMSGMLTNDVGHFKNGLTPTVQNGRVGFIDRTGKNTVPFRYDGIFGIGPSMYQENFRDGITRTAKGDYEFYIDTQGNEYRMPAPMALVNAPSGLKMRQKPDAKAAIILSIDDKSEVEILETTSQKETIEQKTANWLKVKYGNQEGYVFGGFLLKGYRAIAPSGLIVRTTPATTGNKVGSVDINEMVYLLEKTTQKATIEGKTAHWLKVRYQSFNQEGSRWLEGYVFGGFVEAP